MRRHFRLHRVEYDAVGEFKQGLLWKAFETFQRTATLPSRDDLAAFSQRQAEWLDDYTLFMALKEAHGGVSWTEWERAIARREPAAMRDWRKKLAPRIAISHLPSVPVLPPMAELEGQMSPTWHPALR